MKRGQNTHAATQSTQYIECEEEQEEEQQQQQHCSRGEGGGGEAYCTEATQLRLLENVVNSVQVVRMDMVILYVENVWFCR